MHENHSDFMFLQSVRIRSGSQGSALSDPRTVWNVAVSSDSQEAKHVCAIVQLCE